MIGTLQALSVDEDIFHEQRTLGIQKRKTILQKENGKLRVLFFASNPKGLKASNITLVK